MSQNRSDYESVNPNNMQSSYGKRKMKKGRNRNNHHNNHPYNKFQYYSLKYNYQPPWGYWRRRPPQRIHKSCEKQPQRSPSPFSGTEEYTLKKIQETSDMIKKRLMMPETEDIVNTPITFPVNDRTESENEERSSTRDSEKTCVRTNKKTTQYNVEEIHDKIISHISNLNYGKKMNLICANSSGYDVAIQQIHKQKRLELSKVLRDMCSNQTVDNSEAINSIIPDIGIKIEDLPLEVIQELSSTLDLDFYNDSFLQNSFTKNLSVKSEVCENGGVISPTPVVPETVQYEHSNEFFLDNIKQEVLDISDEIRAEDENSDMVSATPVIPETVQEHSNDIFLDNIKQEVLDISDEIKAEDEIGDIQMETSDFEFSLPNISVDLVDNYNPVSAKVQKELCLIDCISEKVHIDFKKMVSVGLQTDLPSLNSISIQTDKPENGQVQIDTENINNLDDAVAAMLKFDAEIMRLTNLRQRIFAALQKKEVEKREHKEETKIKNACSPSPSKKSKISPKSKRKEIVGKSANNKPNNSPREKKDDKNYENVLNLETIDEKILVIEVIEDTILAASDKGNIYYISTSNGSTISIFHACPTPITSLCHWKPKKKPVHFLVGCSDGTLREFNFETQEKLRIINLQSVQCMELKWFYVFVGTATGHLVRYSIKLTKIEFEEKISNDNVMVLKATQEGARKVLLVGMRNEPVCVRDAMSGLYLRTMTQMVTPTVYTLVLENSMVYCGTKLHDILVFSFHDGNLVHKHEAANSKGISCMKVVTNLLFASSYNGNIYVYNVKTHKYVGTIEGPGGVILSIHILKNLVIVGTMSLNFKSILIPDYMLEQNKI